MARNKSLYMFRGNYHSPNYIVNLHNKVTYFFPNSFESVNGNLRLQRAGSINKPKRWRIESTTLHLSCAVEHSESSACACPPAGMLTLGRTSVCGDLEPPGPLGVGSETSGTPRFFRGIGDLSCTQNT